MIKFWKWFVEVSTNYESDEDLYMRLIREHREQHEEITN